MTSPYWANTHPSRNLTQDTVTGEVCILQHHSPLHLVHLEETVTYYVSFLLAVLNVLAWLLQMLLHKGQQLAFIPFRACGVRFDSLL